MKRYLFFFCCVIFQRISNAQNAPGYYYVSFTDKAGTPYSTSFPQAFLSEKSIERRLKWGIPITEQDLPVNPTYVQNVLSATGGSLHHSSKWFNSMTLSLVGLDSVATAQALTALEAMPFVLNVKKNAPDILKVSREKPNTQVKELYHPDSSDYGVSFHQLDMINLPRLHAFGMEGEGMDIAVLDAGWIGLDTQPAFETLRNSGRLIATRDFVHPSNPDVFEGSYHGTYVLGHMAGIIQDSLRGSAPLANYFLMQTENTASEYRIEEDNWVAAIELCDSLGIDVVNSSLGYSLFDDTTMNYTPADMNGDVSRASIAADIAASKGLLIVNSAGNSGNSDWYHITAPSDADSILCIGAVDYWGEHAGFSSYGFENGESVKPNIAAMGRLTYFPGPNGYLAQGSGTSFSSPIIAGAVTCLWQAFPDKSNMEIIHAVEQSASLYPHHNTALGYGIPDFWKAYLLLNNATKLPNKLIVMIFPNPAAEVLHVKTTGSPILGYRIISMHGQVLENYTWLEAWKGNYLDITVKGLPIGEYLLELSTEAGTLCTPFQKF
jgi:serine protease AprX